MTNQMEKNLKSFHLSSVSKDLSTVGAVPKKIPKKAAITGTHNVLLMKSQQKRLLHFRSKNKNASFKHSGPENTHSKSITIL